MYQNLRGLRLRVWQVISEFGRHTIESFGVYQSMGEVRCEFGRHMKRAWEGISEFGRDTIENFRLSEFRRATMRL